MKIKSAKSFRYWYKNLTPARKHAAQFWDENFIGTQHKDLSGFFAMYHGDKTQVYDFLRKEVEMAEDGQAIYEFVQNAADSDSTKFYMFYDKDYLIVINNGSVFSQDGVKSILNIGQSFGKQDPDKIGKYGIGFKLVHRLVGKSSGLDELLNVDKQGHRGPILFSWSEKSQFSNFLKSNEFEYVDFEDKNAPWLLKILITNFPAQPTEKVKDIDYNDIEPFQSEELKNFQTFLNSCSDKIDLNSLDSGTVFFLKLGDKKFDYLERQQQEYLNGLSTSMHFLKSLEILVINDNVVEKDKEATNILEFTVQNGSDDFNEIGLTEIRDKESDAKFKICFADNANSANEIKKHPNIYKYFPAVKEVNNLSFVIHSNLFELSSNRQNLTETPINKHLLRLLSKQVINKMEDFKCESRNTFKNLFTSILMSEESSSNSSGNGWQSGYYYNNLIEYIQKAIPTKGNGFSDKAQNVKINKLKINLDLGNFELDHIKWFEWDKEADKLLIDEATKSEKLGIKEWDIRDIVENASIESINNWIATCDKETYNGFLKELEENYLRKETKEKISQLKLFRFSNAKFYSFTEVVSVKDRLGKTSFKFNNYFFSSGKTKEIKNELIKLGCVVSELSIEDYPNIFSSVLLPDYKKQYDLIAKWCVENGNKLLPEEKKKLFLNFINETTKFDNGSEGTLKDLHLFCDSNSAIKPLNRLIDCKLNTASWLNAYKIKSEEFFTELKPYLVSDQEAIFKDIYLPKQDMILSNITEANEIKSLIKLYQDNKRQFFKEFIIKKTEQFFAIAKKTNNSFQVQSTDKEARDFIDKYCSDKLFILSYNFLEFKDEDGIVKNNDLYTNIIDCVEVDELKEELITIISHHYVSYQAKLKFLNKLTEIKYLTDTQYNNDSFEYKILDLACEVMREPKDFSELREKIIIKSNGNNYHLSDISLFTDKIKIDTKEFSLSKILPSTYQNSYLISDLIIHFSQQGIPSEKLNTLFGVNKEIDINDIYKKFSEQTEILQNAEQFFFLIYYHKYKKNVDLSKLGFDIECAVYPSDFALETEELPEYLQKWIEQGEIKIPSLERIGVYNENSTLVSLRKYFLLKSDFNVNTIAQDKRLSDGKMLLNTLILLKEKGVELNENEFTVFKEMVRVINTSRATGQELKIQDEYNFEVLKGKSTEWQTVGNFTIYLYNGFLPKIVKLNKIQDYVFYSYHDSDYAVNGKNIYINVNEDKTKILQKVALDGNNDFTSEDSKDIELSEVKAELEKYKNQGKPKEDNANSSFDFLCELDELILDLNFRSRIKEKALDTGGNLDASLQYQQNLLAKIALLKHLGKEDLIEEIELNDYNNLNIEGELYKVYSSKSEFAHIQPTALLMLKEYECKIAIYYGVKHGIKLFSSIESLFELNDSYIFEYQAKGDVTKLLEFLKLNNIDSYRCLMINPYIIKSYKSPENKKIEIDNEASNLI